MSEVKFVLEPGRIRFRRDGNGVEMMTASGDTHRVGSVLSAFPLTNPVSMIAVRDEDGEEIGILRHLRGLDPRSHHIIEEELERSYFMPQIIDIFDIGEKLGIVTWEVETSRGPRTFEVRNVRQNVRRMGRQRFIVKDVDGNRYDINDWLALPAPAQRLLEPYL